MRIIKKDEIVSLYKNSRNGTEAGEMASARTEDRTYNTSVTMLISTTK